MPNEFCDGDLVISFQHNDLRITSLCGAFDKRRIHQALVPMRNFKVPDHCSISINRLRQEPHPVFKGETVLQGIELVELNIFYDRSGAFFIERSCRHPDGEDGSDRPERSYPCRDQPRQFMIRRWMGQNYGRIPLECFVDLAQALSITDHFIAQAGQAWPGIRWLEETAMHWHFYLRPEDDWPNRNEHLRPASQVPLPELETLRQLGSVYSDFF